MELCFVFALNQVSPSSRRAWIEICHSKPFLLPSLVALLAEGVDRNSYWEEALYQKKTSPSSRRAWIEIAPRWGCFQPRRVALLAEGVDRNWTFSKISGSSTVALLAEGVDRNFTLLYFVDCFAGSPSSRRAWIEILYSS